MKYVIIGGGIAGLYAALTLIDIHNIKPSDIIVFEKSHRWGRRVHTLEKDGIIYESAAGRFSKDHKLLFELILRYNLTDKLIQLSNKTQNRQILNEKIMIPTNLEPYFEKLYSIQHNRETLMGKSLFDVATEMFGIEIATLLKSAYGYDDDFKTVGAYDNLKLASLMNNDIYYVMNGGLEQIIDHMVSELETRGVELQLHAKCIGWNKDNNGYTNVIITDFKGLDTTVKCQKIILALDKWGLLHLKELEPIYNLLDSVSIIPLTRIYARFPIDPNTGFSWFHGIPKTTTNLPLRMFIPIDETNGFCMISYSDGHHATQWQHDYMMSDLDNIVMKYIRQLFPEKNIPDALWIQKLHWANGVHGWKPLINSDLVYDQIQNPFHNVFICGEAYSRWQGWIEGALETALEVSNKVVLSENDKTRLITFQEVSQSNNLTIIDNRVYDLSKMDWLNKHPGGDIIKKAVGVDSTHMYKYIGHPAYVMNILEDLYVGDLIVK
jgi:cytochrome b involved in lipid metabolism